MLDMCGIYLIRNSLNGKGYVGQSIHIHRRWHEHKKCSKRGDKSHLYDAIRKYGTDSFELIVLELCDPIHFDERESHWMTKYDCRNPDFGYNLMPAGQRGRIMDADCRERIASKLRGVRLSPEQIEKIRAANIGRTHSTETRSKISESNKGKHSKSNPKLSEALKQRYLSLTPEEKTEYARKRSGFFHSLETRQAMSEARKGQPKSEQTRQKHRDRMANESTEVKERRITALRIATQERWAKWRTEKEQRCN
jgi:group I intron endonuclease